MTLWTRVGVEASMAVVAMALVNCAYRHRARIDRGVVVGLLGGLLGAALAWLLTGWPVAVAVGALVGIAVPVLHRQDRARVRRRARAEAMGAWIAQIRACLAGGLSVSESLRVAIERAPSVISEDLASLRAGLDNLPADQALRRWAERVGPDMTSVAASLVLVVRGEGAEPSELLGELVNQWRERAAASRRLERDRAQMRWSARAAGTLALGIPLLLRFMDPTVAGYYHSLSHQAVLAVGMGLVLASVAIWTTADRRAGKLL
jgi:Flp pilus assembly protein TadB